MAEERLRLVPGRGLFGMFRACRSDPDGRGAWIEPSGACRLAWEHPLVGLQALGIWWRAQEGGSWSLTGVSRHFPTEVRILRASAAEGWVLLRLSAASAPVPDGASLEGWRCRRGVCEGTWALEPEGIALGAVWLGMEVLNLRMPDTAGGLRWGSRTS